MLSRVSYAQQAGCDPRTRHFLTEYANCGHHVLMVGGQFERLVPVGSTPTSVTDNMIPWSNGEDAWVTTRKVLVRFQPGSLTRNGL